MNFLIGKIDLMSLLLFFFGGEVSDCESES